MYILQTVYFAYIFNYCVILATADTYSIKDITGALNDFETSDTLFRMFPNKYLRSKMAIQVDSDQSNIISEKDDLSMGDLNLNKQQKDILRKRWRSSCDRKASRACFKACQSTYKSVCSSYKCKRSMKRSFKRECRRNCKAKFEWSKYSDNE